MLNALDRLTSGFTSEGARVRKELAIAEAQLRDYQARLGVHFVYGAYLDKLTALRDLLKAALAGATADANAEPLSDTAELAEQIRSLKTANLVESPPQRAAQPRIRVPIPESWTASWMAPSRSKRCSVRCSGM